MLSPAASTCAWSPVMYISVNISTILSLSIDSFSLSLYLSLSPHSGAGFDWEHELSFRPASRLSWQYLQADALLLVSGASGQTNIRSAPPSLQPEPRTQGHLSTQGPLSVSRGPVKFSVIPPGPYHFVNYPSRVSLSLSLTLSVITSLPLALHPWQRLYATF